MKHPLQKLLILAFCSLFLSSCGFQALYSLDKEPLPPIFIEPIPEQDGQFMHIELSYLLNSQTSEQLSDYTLKIELASVSSSLSGHPSGDGGVWWQIETIAKIILLNNHKTIDNPLTDNKKPVLQKNFLERGGFPVGHAPAAYHAGKYEAKQQVIQQLARDIRSEITLYFFKNPPQKS
jgi:hypothetical protein